MTTPCNIDTAHDHNEMCPYCDALPQAKCRSDELSEIAAMRLRGRLTKAAKKSSANFDHTA